MSSSNETSPTRGISSWWKQAFKKNQSNDSFNLSSSPPRNNIDDVLITRRSNEQYPPSSLTRPTLKFKSKSSNSVRPSSNNIHNNNNGNNQYTSNEQLIRQQRDYFMASQNQKFGFGNEVFGVPLEESINVAESLISVPSDSPDDFIHYGRIPLLVGKCGSYLKEKGLKVEGIFRVAGASRRVKELQYVFSTPPEYGRKLNWEGYTVHDAASLIRRFLNNLPEPLVPLALYDEFREPVKSRPRILKHIKTRNDTIEKRIRMKQLQTNDNNETNTTNNNNTTNTKNDDDDLENKDDFQLTPEEIELKKQKAARKQKKIAKDLRSALKEYRSLIDKLPQAQKQLLFYLLDILSMFADNSTFNLMPARNLAAIFQPSILSHPNHDLTPEEYALSQAVVELLIEYSKRLLPDVRKYEHSTTNSVGGNGNVTNDSASNLTKSYPNSVKNSSTNLLGISNNNGGNGISSGNRPHSRSLSYANGVPDAINPKNYNNTVTSSGLTKNRTRSESNLIENFGKNDDNDDSSDDELYHPAESNYPDESKPVVSQPQIQIEPVSTPPTFKEEAETQQNHKPTPIPINKPKTSDSNNTAKSISPTSPGFHIPHFSRPRPLSMFTGNSSTEDFSVERESRWSQMKNSEDSLNVGKKDPWYKRLRSSSRSKSEKE